MSGSDKKAIRVKVHLRCFDIASTSPDHSCHSSAILVTNDHQVFTEMKTLVLIDFAILKTVLQVQNYFIQLLRPFPQYFSVPNSPNRLECKLLLDGYELHPLQSSALFRDNDVIIMECRYVPNVSIICDQYSPALMLAESQAATTSAASSSINLTSTSKKPQEEVESLDDLPIIASKNTVVTTNPDNKSTKKRRRRRRKKQLDSNQSKDNNKVGEKKAPEAAEIDSSSSDDSSDSSSSDEEEEKRNDRNKNKQNSKSSNQKPPQTSTSQKPAKESNHTSNEDKITAPAMDVRTLWNYMQQSKAQAVVEVPSDSKEKTSSKKRKADQLSANSSNRSSSKGKTSNPTSEKQSTKSYIPVVSPAFLRVHQDILFRIMELDFNTKSPVISEEVEATIVSIVIEEGFEHDPTLGLRMKEEDEEDEDEERELHWSDLVEVRLVQKSSSSSNDKESLAQLKQNWLAMLDT